ncbi:MAG: hypothetical protein GPJ54_11570 [Candidatus Heimdallarchaeota archaeon]|nr:hypothetical protein [Candidatus Heimdallarchaeota archaeon]
MKQRLVLSAILMCILIITMSTYTQSMASETVHHPEKETATISPNINSDWTWSWPDVISSGSTGSSYTTSVAIDKFDNIHLVWYDNTDYNGAGPDNDIFYKRFDRLTASWGSVVVISNDSTADSSNPNIIVDDNDNLHVVWNDLTDYNGAGTDVDIFYKRFDRLTASWGSTVVISSESTSSSSWPTIAADSYNDLHVVWQDSSNIISAGTDGDIFYKMYYNLTSTWLTTKLISTESSLNSAQPNILIDSADDIHIVWDDLTDYNGAGTDTDIFYKKIDAYSLKGGSTVVISTESTAGSTSPKITADSVDNLHIVWRDSTDINWAGTDLDVFYKKYDIKTASWGFTGVISTESTETIGISTIAIDNADNIHIVWDDYTNYNGAGLDSDIFYRKYNSQSLAWGGSFDLSRNTDASFFPAISIDRSGFIHVFWDDEYDYLGAGSDPDIFYTVYSGLPDAPVLDLFSPNPSNGSVGLTWSAVYGSEYYNIYRDTSHIYDLTGLTPIGGTTNTFAKDFPLSKGDYFYAITALNVMGEGAPSNTQSVKIDFDSAGTLITPVSTTETIFNGTNTVTVTVAGVATITTSNDNFAPFMQFALVLPIIVIVVIYRRKRN